jgi:hypothetical protein
LKNSRIADTADPCLGSPPSVSFLGFGDEEGSLSRRDDPRPRVTSDSIVPSGTMRDCRIGAPLPVATAIRFYVVYPHVHKRVSWPPPSPLCPSSEVVTEGWPTKRREERNRWEFNRVNRMVKPLLTDVDDGNPLI